MIVSWLKRVIIELKKAGDKMNNCQEWEKAYGCSSNRHKNIYPFLEVIQFMRKNYDGCTGVKLLEVGCGWGNNLKLFDDLGIDFYGVDFSHTAIEHCHQLGFKNTFVGNISNLHFDDNTFDCVVDRQSVQHNERIDIEGILFEIKRVLKPDGLFFSSWRSTGETEFITTLFDRNIQVLFANIFGRCMDYNWVDCNDKIRIYNMIWGGL